MKSKRKPCTAAELMARLQADPDWVRRDAEHKAKHSALVERIQKEIDPENRPLMAELTAAGVKVRMSPKRQLMLPPEQRPGKVPVPIRSVEDLVYTRDSYPEAIPILIKHLRTVRHPIMVDIITRALTVKEARGTEAPRIILDRLKQTSPSTTQIGDEYQARWALANALTVIADAKMAFEMEQLIADAHYEDVKECLEMAVKKIKTR